MLCAISGLASAAAAQSGALMIVASQTVVDSTITSVVTLSVYASADFGTHIEGGSFALDAQGGEGIVTGMDGEAVPWAVPGDNDRGHLGDGNYLGFVYGQLVFEPFFPPAIESALDSGPVHIVTFTVDIAAFEYGVINWMLTADALAPDEFFGVYDQNIGSSTLISNVSFGSVQIAVVPAPAGFTAIALGGVVFGRRRR